MCEGADLTKLEMQVVKRVLMCPHTISMCPHTAMYAKRLPTNLVMPKRPTNACKETSFTYVFYVYTIHNIYIVQLHGR
jgi:hypothetical protein